MLTGYERSPHFTLVTGFIGPNRLVMMLIKVGGEYVAPHALNAQCLQRDWVVVIAQSPNGWVDKRLKTAFFQLQLDCPHLPVGTRPCWFNLDGHDTNTRNPDLERLASENDVGLVATPAHTSAASHGRTQQCDLPAYLGGPIARIKVVWRKYMRKLHRAAMERPARKGVVSVPEIAACLEKAAQDAWDGDKAISMNEEVGYFINSEGLVDWDLSGKLAPAGSSVDAHASGSRRRRREAVQQ